MELRQLRYFVAVAEELHFGRAALRLHIAEQALGQQIRKLENELGFQLLERTTRSVSLTPAGVSLLADARRILEGSEAAVDSARRIAEGQSGVVRLGYEAATIPSIMPDFVRLFRAEYPEIDLVLKEHSKGGIESLFDGETDACLVTRYEDLPNMVRFVPVKDDMAVVAIPTEHPLATRESLSPAELKGMRFLGYEGPEGAKVNLFLSALSLPGTGRQSVVQEADTAAALLGLVAAGLGFTIVTNAMSYTFPDKVSYIPMTDPSVRVQYGLAFLESSNEPLISSLEIVAKDLAKIL